MKPYGDLDSKFRFVILASKRAKQLLRGAKPKVKLKTKNLIRLAQEEVKRGVIGYEITKPHPDERQERGDEGFIGEKLEVSKETYAQESPGQPEAELEQAEEEIEDREEDEEIAETDEEKDRTEDV